MTSMKALAYFQGNCKRWIVADAGPDGLGAVLPQFQEDEWRAVLYMLQVRLNLQVNSFPDQVNLFQPREVFAQ